MTKILGIIPSRYGSTRFPAKALADINGKTMVERVYEQACKATSLAEVVVATDHEKIFSYVQSIGGKVVMTKDSHPSGTDRCAEVLNNMTENYDFVINIQGDEPFIKPEQINLLASVLSDAVELATLVIETQKDDEIFNPNTVKVAVNSNSEALYFSRSPIPFVRNFPQNEWTKHHKFYRHVGIYAYRTDILHKITMLQPSGLEQTESLEQLRWLENGYKIKVQKTPFDSHGIDTPQDLQRILEAMK